MTPCEQPEHRPHTRWFPAPAIPALVAAFALVAAWITTVESLRLPLILGAMIVVAMWALVLREED